MQSTKLLVDAPVLQLDLIDLAARVAGMTVNDFLLVSAARHAQQVLLEGGPGSWGLEASSPSPVSAGEHLLN